MSDIITPQTDGASWSARTVEAGREAMAGRTRGLSAFLPFVGPAVIASIAYMDPGNFATNIEAGSKHGYLLIWVVVLANLIAMLFQALSAKLGIVTNRSLAEHCRDRLPGPVVLMMWIASEVAAMATDLAEFLGGAIGLSLLFGLPLLASLAITGVVTYAVLALQGTGFRPIEVLIGGFVSLIGLCYLVEMIIAPPDWRLFAYHALVPGLDGLDSAKLAVGIVGATVMPHAIYLHSSLTRGRIPADSPAERGRVLRYSNIEVLAALGFAGLVNMAMIAMAARVFHDGVNNDIADIATAYQTLTPLLGAAAAFVFMASLLASGFSSSIVGTMAGQAIMAEFTHWRIPLWLRRAITMLPSFAVVAYGVNSTQALILSQVVLSVIVPIPMIALLWLTGRRDVMGDFVSRPLTRWLAVIATVLVVALNMLLIGQLMGLVPDV
jgi:manganese transport protein